MEVLLCGLGFRPPPWDKDVIDVRKHLKAQDKKIDQLHDRLDDRSERIQDMRSDVVDMMDELDALRRGAGKLRAAFNLEKATSAVLNLSNVFDGLDKNANNSIDANELRRGLASLGLDSHSPHAKTILSKYSEDPEHTSMDVKAFSSLVRDIQLLLTFDRDGSGTLDVDELGPALRQLGLTNVSDRHCKAILRTWDADKSGRLDLLEFTDLVRSLQTFMKFDKNNSGDIDVDELRPALRRLGLPADTEAANSILMWYDADDSGCIELHEFAMLARDIQVFRAFDADESGYLDAKELLPALSKLGLATNSKEVEEILRAWDENADGHIDLLEFAALVRDLQIFHEFDRDGNGAISSAELRNALRRLGVNLDAREAQDMLEEYDTDHSGHIELPEFRRLAEDLPSLVGRKTSAMLNLDSFAVRGDRSQSMKVKAAHALQSVFDA